MGSIPGSERSSGDGNGNLPQYSCLENSMDRRAWKATVYRVAQSDATEHACTNKACTDRSLCSLPSPTRGPLESKAANS